MYIFLNRLKLYLESLGLTGELLDLCISSLQSPIYKAKLRNYLNEKHFTLKHLIDELDSIITKGHDGKSDTRVIRHELLDLMFKDIPHIDLFFGLMGKFITNQWI
jgi:hypothetical protein